MSSADTETTDTDDETPPEVDERRDAIVSSFADALGDDLLGSHVVPGTDLWIRIRHQAWVEAATHARDTLHMTYFNWLSAIDWLPSPFGRDMEAEQDWVVHGRDEKEPVAMESGVTGGDTRFQVLTRLDDVFTSIGVTIKADLDDSAPSVASLVPVYPGADWHEREAWEMFGITFVGHPGLRKLYLPGGFEGNPLRKDFPLLARRVKPWPGIVDVEAMPGGDDDEGAT